MPHLTAPQADFLGTTSSSRCRQYCNVLSTGTSPVRVRLKIYSVQSGVRCTPNKLSKLLPWRDLLVPTVIPPA
jgi:hypothetical protein